MEDNAKQQYPFSVQVIIYSCLYLPDRQRQTAVNVYHKVHHSKHETFAQYWPTVGPILGQSVRFAGGMFIIARQNGRGSSRKSCLHFRVFIYVSCPESKNYRDN